MRVFTLKKIQIYLLILASGIFFYSYYYLPSKNKGSILLKNEDQIEKTLISNAKNKNFFKNTEYITKDSRNRIFTTKAKESWFFQDDPDTINLTGVLSFTTVQKDQSTLSIKSRNGLYNKKNGDTTYQDEVRIANKNYKITSDSATHIAKKNLIIIEDNVTMTQTIDGLENSIFCDILKIDTITNNAIASMKNKNKKVVAKKIR